MISRIICGVTALTMLAVFPARGDSVRLVDDETGKCDAITVEKL